jgi:PiT family inorganic phosphate transporter
MASLYIVFIIAAAGFLAYANGANDNFKGVATLYSAKSADYKTALIWTSITTLLGSFVAFYLASELTIIFKGKGLVPEAVILMDSFPLAVGVGAALTVMLATILSLPVSTTHALIGALAGAGWLASEAGIHWDMLASKFFLPLIAGPLISLILAYFIYPIFKKFRARLGISQSTSIWLEKKQLASVPTHIANKVEFISHLNKSHANYELIVGDNTICRESYAGSVAGISAGKLLDSMHFLSSGLVCFARGLNDTPKIAALLLIGSRFQPNFSIGLVGSAILIGGLVHSRRIASTMGDKMTKMNPGQAFTANLITGIMVFGASRIGVPVSTTHVSCGSIFGIGAVNKSLNLKIIGHILLAWVTTLPLGFVLGATLMSVI